MITAGQLADSAADFWRTQGLRSGPYLVGIKAIGHLPDDEIVVTLENGHARIYHRSQYVDIHGLHVMPNPRRSDQLHAADDDPRGRGDGLGTPS